MKQKKKAKWWRSRKKTEHHLLPQSRGGKSEGNIVLISENVHKAWHVLFGNRTPGEAEEHLRVLHDFWKQKVRWGVIKVIIVRPGNDSTARAMVEEKSFPFRKEAIAFIQSLKVSRVERTADGYRITLE